MRIAARSIIIVSLLAVLSGLAFAQPKPRGTIVIVNSRGEQKEESGVTINEYTWSALDVKLRTGQRRFDANDIVSVEYDRPPTGYEDARLAFRNGDHRGAIEGFLTLLESDLKDSQAWAAEQAHYYLWASYRRIGAFDDSVKEAAALRALAPKSPYLPEIILQETEDLYGLGDFAGAEQAFAGVSDQAKTQNWATRHKVVADLGRVRALIAQKKTADATAHLGQVSGSIANEELRQRALVVTGELMVASGKIDEARRHYQQLLDGVKDWKAQPFVFAGAANGLGDCAFEQGDWSKAAEEYSKTFALFSDNGKLANEVGWALWRFANANKQMAAKEKDTEKAREYRGRYERLRRTVAQDYRMTRGGQLSRRELGVGQ